MEDQHIRQDILMSLNNRDSIEKIGREFAMYPQLKMKNVPDALKESSIFIEIKKSEKRKKHTFEIEPLKCVVCQAEIINTDHLLMHHLQVHESRAVLMLNEELGTIPRLLQDKLNQAMEIQASNSYLNIKFSNDKNRGISLPFSCNIFPYLFMTKVQVHINDLDSCPQRMNPPKYSFKFEISEEGKTRDVFFVFDDYVTAQNHAICCRLEAQ